MGMSDGVAAGALAEGAVVGMAGGNSGNSKERSRSMWMEEWGIGGGGEWL